ncbi:Hypothetical predicted protein [Podarcis lilfordi]|uniref:Uncharacterized protein n=1 Tax=Podarcis lilfordi TaxID=74358 RepID=A0AA35K514_9SAUR|nr:Hypothetical predicted protein [Podarcis lilfordi]
MGQILLSENGPRNAWPGSNRAKGINWHIPSPSTSWKEPPAIHSHYAPAINIGNMH